MKKIGLLITGILFVSIAFTSCSKDDDGGSASIEGKWTFDKEGVLVDGQEVLIDYEHFAPECGLDYIRFSGDGTGTDGFFDLDADDECVEETESFTWERDGDQLTLDYSGDVDTVEIAKLTSSTLTVYETFGDETFVIVLKK